MGGGGGGNSEPTLQQQQLETAQATENANLNLEENAQRKAILGGMLGMRMFRGSALSRAMAGNTNTGAPAGGPSRSQLNAGRSGGLIGGVNSILDAAAAAASGATPSGGTGASGGGGAGGGGRGTPGRAGARGVNIA